MGLVSFFGEPVNPEEGIRLKPLIPPFGELNSSFIKPVGPVDRLEPAFPADEPVSFFCEPVDPIEEPVDPLTAVDPFPVDLPVAGPGAAPELLSSSSSLLMREDPLVDSELFSFSFLSFLALGLNSVMTTVKSLTVTLW